VKDTTSMFGVAAEIRRLAERSLEAAREIRCVDQHLQPF
jgi:hypothetical protein